MTERGRAQTGAAGAQFGAIAQCFGLPFIVAQIGKLRHSEPMGCVLRIVLVNKVQIFQPNFETMLIFLHVWQAQGINKYQKSI